MADILTHYTLSRVAAIRLARKEECALIIGTILPDIISKSMVFMFEVEMYYTALSHSIVGAILYCALFCALFAGKESGRFFKYMTAGYLLHIAVDVFKDYLGFGIVYPLLPFAISPLEISLYNPYDSVYFLPANILILAAIIYYKK